MVICLPQGVRPCGRFALFMGKFFSAIRKKGRPFSCQQQENAFLQILLSQLKFLYPLKTLAFTAFSPLRFGPFPSFFPLREEMRETFFRPSLQPYPAALRKFAWPLWWRGRKCSLWYLHQNVPAAPAHPWVRLREREGWSYMYASTDGSENHPYFFLTVRKSFVSNPFISFPPLHRTA